jgi:triosephosphate isomerase
MRKAMVAGNWKMNGSQAQVAKLLNGMADKIGDANADVVVCPPHVYLATALAELAGSHIRIGAQNCSEHESGAYTGEVSAAMLADTGCHHVLVGHSERRALFGENDGVVAAKFGAARTAGLQPILCVGETLEERENGRALEVVTKQLAAVFDQHAAEQTTIVAYEPVWAIGTGRTASPEQAQEVHQFIRAWLAESDAAIASEVRILYGGSVKADNAADIFGQADIDGGLIGGASLKQEDFVAIVKAAS